MGVEYRHHLVVNDPIWIPENDTAARVETVLRSWGVVGKLERVVDLTNGLHKEISGATTLITPGAGIGFVYEGITGAAFSRIAGKSVFDNLPDYEGSIQKTVLVVGRDYRVQMSCDSTCFEVVSPPTANGIPIEPNLEELPFECMYLESFPSDRVTTPPIVKVHLDRHAKQDVAWKSFQGFWRGAMAIEFGKNVPQFVGRKNALPNRQFVEDIEQAFRGPLVEVGVVH